MAPSSSESLTSMSATAIAASVHSGAVRAIDAWHAARDAAVSAGEPAKEHRGGSARTDDVGRRHRAKNGSEPSESGNGVAGSAAPASRRDARPVRGAKQLRQEKRERRRRNRNSTDVRAFTGLLDTEAESAAEFVDSLPDDARATLPLAGVPVAIKNNVTLDSPVITRLLAAGAVPVGMTTTPEFCVWAATDSAAYGVTRNPWNRALTPGGSSGGSAAAVAAGFVPIAHGNDGMGSLRIPAACCGLVTLKPGPDVVPTELGAGNWGGMAEDGILATTVDDLAAATAVIAARPELAERSQPNGLRIALALNPPISLGGKALVKTDKKILAATRAVAKALEACGHTVVDASLPYPKSPWPLLARWTGGLDADAAEANFPISRMERRNRYHALLGRVLRRMDTFAAQHKAQEAVSEFMGSGGDAFDLILTPTLATAPIEAEAWHDRSWARSLWANLRYAPYSALFNHIAWPAMNIPAGQARISDVPIGVQLAGRPGAESLLLDAAAQLEREQPWTRTAVE